MHRLAAGLQGRGDQGLSVQIGSRPGSGQGDRRVGPAGVQRLGVVGRIDRDRVAAELRGGARDTDGDLAAVGDQNRLDFQATASRSLPPPPRWRAQVRVANACSRRRAESRWPAAGDGRSGVFPICS
jgi:hypothetical protein